MCVFREDRRDGTPCIIQALLDFVRVFFYVRKMLLNIVSAHQKTVVVNVIEIFPGKLFFPGKRNVAALNDEILLIFNSGLYKWSMDRYGYLYFSSSFCDNTVLPV